MFSSARFKLTAWYVLIVMLISFCFSLVIFQLLTKELAEFEFKQRRVQEEILNRMVNHGQSCSFVVRLPKNEQLIQESRQNLIIGLGLVNGIILVLSGFGSYFLAGKTLKPIQEMVEEQQRFVSDASHELRTPLSALRCEIEVSLRDKNLTLPVAKRILESNLEEVLHLQQLSDNLLLLHKLDHSPTQFEHETQQVSLKSTIQQAIDQVSAIATHKHIQIQAQLADITIRGRAVELVQLVVILLENAIKYSPAHTTIDIKVHKKSSDQVEIMITDHGQGIASKELPYIFDRFYRADSSRTNSQEQGFGLGLAIAKQIIDQYNGDIHVTSQKNKGSVFTITLPLI